MLDLCETSPCLPRERREGEQGESQRRDECHLQDPIHVSSPMTVRARESGRAYKTIVPGCAKPRGRGTPHCLKLLVLSAHSTGRGTRSCRETERREVDVLLRCDPRTRADRELSVHDDRAQPRGRV